MAVCPPGGCDVEETRLVPYAEDAKYAELVDVFRPAEPGRWPVVILAHGIYGSRLDV